MAQVAFVFDGFFLIVGVGEIIKLRTSLMEVGLGVRKLERDEMRLVFGAIWMLMHALIIKKWERRMFNTTQ